MAYYHVKKPGIMVSGEVYYKGNASWTQTYDDRAVYTNKSNVEAMIRQDGDGLNGGFVGATIVTE